MRVILPPFNSVTMDEVIANSFRNYHVKGFDYICLRRSPMETIKLYFFDGDVSKMPEAVNPHDHRYDFNTWCVTGQVQNIWYEEAAAGDVYNRFAYDTPLLGGTGFSWVGETRLLVKKRSFTKPGQRYVMAYNEIHTIRMLKDQTVIMLVQYEDKVSDRPTLTFCRDREPPSLTGLYDRFTPDQVLDRMRTLGQIAPNFRVPAII